MDPSKSPLIWILIKKIPDGLGARFSKSDNEHSFNSEHGADGEERSSQSGEGWQLFSFLYFGIVLCFFTYFSY